MAVTYAEPLEPGPEPANLIIQITSHSSFDDEVLKWYDGRRPFVVGEDGVRTACRPLEAKVDHEAGLGVLGVPVGHRCLNKDDLPAEVEVGVSAWGDGAVDFVDDAVVPIARG